MPAPPRSYAPGHRLPFHRPHPPIRGSSTDSHFTSHRTGVAFGPCERLPERSSLGPAYRHLRPWRALWTWTRGALWRSCSEVASKPLVSCKEQEGSQLATASPSLNLTPGQDPPRLRSCSVPKESLSFLQRGAQMYPLTRPQGSPHQGGGQLCPGRGALSVSLGDPEELSISSLGTVSGRWRLVYLVKGVPLPPALRK